MPPITDIVKHLIILNVLVFIAYQTPIANYLPDLALYWPQDDQFKPYQLVTHMFMHSLVSPRHLIFNMFGLYIFGSMVERVLGASRFLKLYLICGLGSLIAHILIQYYLNINYGQIHFPGVVGASGAIMGITIAYAVMFPNHKLMLLFPPIPIKAKYLAAAFIIIDLYSGLSGSQNGVANWAHLGGALTGFIMMRTWLKK